MGCRKTKIQRHEHCCCEVRAQRVLHRVQPTAIRIAGPQLGLNRHQLALQKMCEPQVMSTRCVPHRDIRHRKCFVLEYPVYLCDKPSSNTVSKALDDSATCFPSQKAKAGPQSMYDAFKKWSLLGHTFTFVKLTTAEVESLGAATRQFLEPAGDGDSNGTATVREERKEGLS